MRLKSVSNIAKITKSMKMIASTKVARAQKGMETARAFGSSFASVFEHAGTSLKEDAKNPLLITVSSDRGLCGGIHSSVSKATKKSIQSPPTARATDFRFPSCASVSEINPRVFKYGLVANTTQISVEILRLNAYQTQKATHKSLKTLDDYKKIPSPNSFKVESHDPSRNQGICVGNCQQTTPIPRSTL